MTQYPNYPDPSVETDIAIDTETRDPGLKKWGPGTFRGDSYVLGVSVAFESGHNEYYSLHHDDINPEVNKRNWYYIRDVLASSADKIGANLAYDIEHLEVSEGYTINGQLHDTQIAEPLIYELRRGFALDALAESYLGEHKKDEELKEWCDAHDLKGDPREHIYRMPFALVREYALPDTTLPMRIWHKQRQILTEKQLWEAYETERKLLRVVLMMRYNGVLIDTEKRDSTTERLSEIITNKQTQLRREIGDINPRSGPQLASYFEHAGYELQYSEKGNARVDQYFLKSLYEKSDAARLILDVRQLLKLRDTFVAGAFRDFCTSDGRIHPQFNQLRGDENGTITGRFSCTKPNLQQVPTETEYGKLCRELFIPEPGTQWAKFDYSQIEYRVMAHFAVGPGADAVRYRYNNDPNVDFHSYIEELTKLQRKRAKNLNFGVGFGMGRRKMAEFFGWSQEYCDDVLNIYHRNAPFMRSTLQRVGNVAKKRGYVRLIDGRRSHLDNRKYSYKKFNHLVQGSAAVIMKRAMVAAYNAGLFETMKLHLTVHDELDQSVPETPEGTEAMRELARIMEETTKLKVPIKVDTEAGENWGDVEEIAL